MRSDAVHLRYKRAHALHVEMDVLRAELKVLRPVALVQPKGLEVPQAFPRAGVVRQPTVREAATRRRRAVRRQYARVRGPAESPGAQHDHIG